MNTTPREAAMAIWQAGVDEVRAERLVQARVRLEDERLVIDQRSYALQNVNTVCVVGAGKAAGFLAQALEQELAHNSRINLTGWVNVPANCVRRGGTIHLHAARPAEVNEPRPEGVEGTLQILNMVASLQPEDLCLCVLTGGGSALLPAPVAGISLQDKINLTRLLSERGATIEELNRVRIGLSAVKGGGLARACRAGQLVTMIISDVIGDPLDLIASGPTIQPPPPGPEDAPETLLARFVEADEVPAHIWRKLKASAKRPAPPSCKCSYHLLANNALAVEAAAGKAKELGWTVRVLPPEPAKTNVESVARQLAAHVAKMGPKSCTIWGGEPVIRLAAAESRGLGGRNQHLVLELFRLLEETSSGFPADLCILSGGTDGEDGPTDAAGAWVDAAIAQRARDQTLEPAPFLRRNDSYSFFQQVESLIRTGPTHTNVCDVRVIVRQ